MRVVGLLWWMYVLCIDEWMLYYIDFSRGYLVIEFMGVLLVFVGILVYDYYKVYFCYVVFYVLCNVYYLREL